MRRRLLIGMVFLQLLVILISASPTSASTPGYRLLTAPAAFRDIQGVQLMVPIGAVLPSETQLWSTIQRSEVQRRQVSRGPGTHLDLNCCIPFPMNWYGESSSYGGHSPWLLGASLQNTTDQANQQTFTMSGSVQSTFSGSVSANKVVTATYSLSYTVSLSIATQYTVPAHSATALWGSAWQTTHVGSVHYDVLWYDPFRGLYTFSPGNVESVFFTIPTAPNFVTTNFCVSCYPTPPSF